VTNHFDFSLEKSKWLLHWCMGIKQRNITGKKYGLLTAVCWVKNEKFITKSGKAIYHNYWKFSCECGRTKILRKWCVASGKNPIRSCGCLVNKHKWKGCGDISGTYWGAVKKSASIRKIDFIISIEGAWQKYVKQGGICALSGVPIKFKSKQTASLDRINSKLGYTEDNTQWVHKDLNIMKWDHTLKEFLTWCRLVSQYNEDN
jgi:hypothetical protein